MASIIDWGSTATVKHFRKNVAALAVYWVYLARTSNVENIAYPSIRGLARDTGYSIPTCLRARRWLVENNALERIDDYVHPDFRSLPDGERRRAVGLDKREYYRPTGYIVIDGRKHRLTYNKSVTETNEEPDDQSARRSTGLIINGVDQNIIQESKHNTNKTLSASSNSAEPPIEEEPQPLVADQNEVEATEPPRVNATMRRKPVPREQVAELEREFCEATGLPVAIVATTSMKEAQSLWWSQLAHMIRLSDMDVNKASDRMLKAIEELRERGLTINSPKSITKTFVASIAEGTQTKQAIW